MFGLTFDKTREDAALDILHELGTFLAEGLAFVEGEAFGDDDLLASMTDPQERAELVQSRSMQVPGSK
jgi:hypothetical protein